jgi:chromosome partitioning protein
MNKPQNAKITAVAAQKGGIGKTTTAVNLASCIAMKATPVLVLDLDPQGSTMDWVAMMDRNDKKLFDYVMALESSLDTIIKNNIKHYKYIIIDCPPRLEKIMAKVINIADLVITPVGLGAIEAWAFDDFNQGIKHHQETHQGRPKQAVFLSDVDPRRTRLIKSAQDNITYNNFNNLQTIYTRTSVIEAAETGSCTIHMNDAKASHEIKTLTTQVLEILHEL